MVLSEKQQKLEQMKETNAELEKSSDATRKDYRVDGYKNMLNKYGTAQDNTEAYQFTPEGKIPDIELTHQYESNGLFAKIIDTPAEEVVKHDFDLGIEDDDVNTLIRDAMESLDWEERFADAIRWARLYGGSIIVMMINDGGGLEEPVNWRKVKGIDELLVFERSIVFPDYTSLYRGYGDLVSAHSKSKFGMPEYFYVFSLTGQFKVHESRCLVFRNGRMPQLGMTQDYRFWGVPEYQRIKRALRETVTAHGDSVKLLERSVQAIYKMKNLAQLLATDEGEEQALKRLQVIDMARGILSSIAIDSEGEDYGFQTFSVSGIKEVIDSTCNMLSAITEIPQTKLFGRSPAGMSATGESDLENYYSFLEKIQKLMMKSNLNKLIDIICYAAIKNGRMAEMPNFKLKFQPLWSLSEMEQAQLEQTKAATAQTKAATAMTYVDMGVLDPSEVRAGLKGSEDYVIQDLIDEEADDEILTPAEREALLQIKMQALAPQPEQPEMPDMEQGNPMGELNPPEENPVQEDVAQVNADSDDITASAVIVIDKDGGILCGERKDGQGICGAGGHREGDETPEETACRETWEEFGITLEEIIPLGIIESNGDKAQIFVSTAFSGEPLPNTQEMQNNRFLKPHQLKNATLFEPFKLSLRLMVDKYDEIVHKGEQSVNNEQTAFTNPDNGDIIQEEDGGKGSGKPPNYGGKKLPTVSPEVFHEALASGKISKKLDAKKQNKHIKGTPEYQKCINEGRRVSTITLSLDEMEKLVDDNLDNGVFYSDGKQFKLTIKHTSSIGTCVSSKGKEEDTTRLTAHFSKTGMHLVPSSPEKGGK